MRYKEPTEIAELKKLNELLNVNWKLTPSYHDAKFIILTCGQTIEMDIPISTLTVDDIIAQFRPSGWVK